MAHGAGGGPFELQRVTDTSMRVSFGTRQNLNFQTSGWTQIFDISFNGFSYGTGCTISNAVLEVSTSSTPGSGFNNTIAPDIMTCSRNRITIQYTNRVWNSIWGAIAGTAAFDNYFAIG